MICSEFLVHLDDLLDDTLDPTLRHAMQAHLEICEHCTITVTTTRKTIEVYRTVEIYDLPVDLRDRLRAAILAKCKKVLKLLLAGLILVLILRMIKAPRR